MIEKHPGSEEPKRTWRFRLRFFLPRTRIFQFEEDTRHIELAPGLHSTLQTTSGKPLRDECQWILRAGGFKSEAAALRAGQRAKAALQVLRARLRVGFDVGKESSMPRRLSPPLM